MQIRITIFLIFLITNKIQSLQFMVYSSSDVDHYEKYQNYRHPGKLRGEDAYQTTPTCISIARGVTNYNFSTRHIASYSVFNFQRTIRKGLEEGTLDFRDNKQTTSYQFLKKLFKNSIIDYIGLLKEGILDWNKQETRKFEDYREKLEGGATLIGAFIIKSDEKEKLKLIQVGNCKAIVMKLVSNDRFPGQLYLPSFVTIDHQLDVHTPHQIAMTKDNEFATDIKIHSTDIDENAIVILGSEGFFDNIHYVLISIIPNLMAEYLHTFGHDYRAIQLGATNFVEMFVQSLIFEEDWLKKMVTTPSPEVFETNEVSNPAWLKENTGVYYAVARIFLPSRLPKTINFKYIREQRFKQVIEERKKFSKLFDFEYRILTKVFQCPLLELVSNPETLLDGKKHGLSKCIENAFMDSFIIDDEKVKKLSDRYSGELLTKILGSASVSLAKLKHNYPSPLFVKEARSGITNPEPKGKFHTDVTVTAQFIGAKDRLNDDLKKRINAEIDQSAIQMHQDLTEDLRAFLDYDQWNSARLNPISD